MVEKKRERSKQRPSLRKGIGRLGSRGQKIRNQRREQNIMEKV